MLRGVFNSGAGSGGGISGVKAAGVMAQSSVPASVTGTLTETVLATIPIPAAAMGVNGSLRVTTLWSYANSANNKILKAVLGGTAFASVTATTTASMQHITQIRNRGAANSQVGFSPFVAGGLAVTANAVITGTINTGAAQNLTLTGTLANVGETITLEGYTVEILNP